MEALVYQVFFIGIELILNPCFLCPILHEAQPGHHHLIVFFQNGRIPVGFIQCPRHQNTGIPPAGGALKHIGNVTSAVIYRCNIGNQSILFLSKTALCQPLTENGIAVRKIGGGWSKGSGIACPSGSFPGGTVRGNVTEVAAHTPQTVQEQTVHILVAAGKEARLLHFGVDRNGSKPRIRQVDIGFNFRVAEAEDGKAGLIDIQTFLTGVIKALGDAAVFVPLARIEIGLREVSILIQCFTVPEGDLLS